MAAFTALALGLLGGALGLFGGEKLAAKNSDAAAPQPLSTSTATLPTPPPSTAQSAAAAVPLAQDAATQAKKRAAAGDTLLTAAQTPTQTAQASTSPLRLLGK